MAAWDFGYWREACGITCIIFSTRLVIGWRFSAGLVEGWWDPGFDFDSVVLKDLFHYEWMHKLIEHLSLAQSQKTKSAFSSFSSLFARLSLLRSPRNSNIRANNDHSRNAAGCLSCGGLTNDISVRICRRRDPGSAGLFLPD